MKNKIKEMSPEQWQKIKAVFKDAQTRTPEEREVFLDEVCDGDKEMRREIESLLSFYKSAESFLETPLVEKMEDEISTENYRFADGQNFNHYEIIRQIGAGGMGEVYLARDKKLNRQVAIKILNEKFARHESNLNRFVQEAKAASGLNHPNILVIHEIGETESAHYIVSEYIEGKTLRHIFKEKTLEMPEILDIAIQIGSALTAAHAAGIVHRDIKPENIMVRPDGFLKILDFGLAKLVAHQAIGFEETTIRQNQTAAGVIMGTVQYMSPEQAKGERVDARTDIFSFGVLVYEMIAGRTPFAGDSVSETFANLIKAEPKLLSHFAANVPDELQRVVSKMLRKNKDERYQTMKGLLSDLKDLKENLSFAEKLERSQSPTFDNTTAVLQAETGGANKQTVKTQRSFLQKIKNLKLLLAFVVLVALLAGAIAFYQYWNLNQPGAAQDLYLQGRFYGWRENKADNDKAIELLEQTVALDPNHALAHAELARVYGRRYFYLEPQQKQWEEKAYVELEKAFALTPDLPEAHEVRGYLLWMPANRFPHEQAIAAYQRALVLNPNLDESHHQLGLIYLHIGLFDEGLRHIRKALELNPGNTLARFRVGVALGYQGRYEEALQALKSSPPSFNPALNGRETAWLLIQLGQRGEAAELLTEMLEKYPKDEGAQFTSLKAMLSALAGNESQAEQEIQDSIEKGKGFGHFHHAAYNIASAYAAMNKPDQALRFLRMAADDGYPCYPLFANDAILNPIRQNPKFQAFLTAQKRQWEYFKSLPQL